MRLWSSLLRTVQGSKAGHKTDYGGYSGYFADPDGHPFIEVGDDRRVHLPD